VSANSVCCEYEEEHGGAERERGRVLARGGEQKEVATRREEKKRDPAEKGTDKRSVHRVVAPDQVEPTGL